MWPFSRRSGRKAEGSSPAGGPRRRTEPTGTGVFRPPAPGWSTLPSMPTALPTVDLTLNRSFDRELAAFQETRLTAAPLGHAVSHDAPAGLVRGLAVQRTTDGGVPLPRACQGPDLIFVAPPAGEGPAAGDASAPPCALPSRRAARRAEPASPGPPAAPGRGIQPRPAGVPAPAHSLQRSVSPPGPQARFVSAAEAPLRPRPSPRSPAPRPPTAPAPDAPRDRAPAAAPPAPRAPHAQPGPGGVRRRRLGAPLAERPPMVERVPSAAESAAIPGLAPGPAPGSLPAPTAAPTPAEAAPTGTGSGPAGVLARRAGKRRPAPAEGLLDPPFGTSTPSAPTLAAVSPPGSGGPTMAPPAVSDPATTRSAGAWPVVQRATASPGGAGAAAAPSGSAPVPAAASPGTPARRQPPDGSTRAGRSMQPAPDRVSGTAPLVANRAVTGDLPTPAPAVPTPAAAPSGMPLPLAVPPPDVRAPVATAPSWPGGEPQARPDRPVPKAPMATGAPAAVQRSATASGHGGATPAIGGSAPATGGSAPAAAATVGRVPPRTQVPPGAPSAPVPATAPFPIGLGPADLPLTTGPAVPRVPEAGRPATAGAANLAPGPASPPTGPVPRLASSSALSAKRGRHDAAPAPAVAHPPTGGPGGPAARARSRPDPMVQRAASSPRPPSSTHPLAVRPLVGGGDLRRAQLPGPRPPLGPAPAPDVPTAQRSAAPRPAHVLGPRLAAASDGPMAVAPGGWAPLAATSGVAAGPRPAGLAVSAASGLALPSPAPTAAPDLPLARSLAAPGPSGAGNGPLPAGTPTMQPLKLAVPRRPPALPVQHHTHPPSSPTPPPRRPARRQPAAALNPATPVPSGPRSVQRSAGSAAGEAAASAAPDVDSLVDMVLRRVRDQLRLDRERRGAIADRKP